MKKVFLGGTWREELIKDLTIDYFNPVVEHWTSECQAEELLQRENCDFCLYTITSETPGSYSIAEVVDDSNKRPEKTILCVLEEGLDTHQLKFFKQIARMVVLNGSVYFTNLSDVAEYLNKETK